MWESRSDFQGRWETQGSSPLHFAAFLVTPNQARRLGPAQPGHLGSLAPHQPLARAFQTAIILLTQRPVHPLVQLPSVLAVEPHLLTGFHQRPDLLQALSRSPSSMRIINPQHAESPSGSSCMRQDCNLTATLRKDIVEMRSWSALIARSLSCF
jgi:hypothetical protein